MNRFLSVSDVIFSDFLRLIRNSNSFGLADRKYIIVEHNFLTTDQEKKLRPLILKC